MFVRCARRSHSASFRDRRSSSHTTYTKVNRFSSGSRVFGRGIRRRIHSARVWRLRSTPRGSATSRTGSRVRSRDFLPVNCELARNGMATRTLHVRVKCRRDQLIKFLTVRFPLAVRELGRNVRFRAFPRTLHNRVLVYRLTAETIVYYSAPAVRRFVVRPSGRLQINRRVMGIECKSTSSGVRVVRNVVDHARYTLSFAQCCTTRIGYERYITVRAELV